MLGIAQQVSERVTQPGTDAERGREDAAWEAAQIGHKGGGELEEKEIPRQIVSVALQERARGLIAGTEDGACGERSHGRDQ